VNVVVVDEPLTQHSVSVA